MTSQWNPSSGNGNVPAGAIGSAPPPAQIDDDDTHDDGDDMGNDAEGVWSPDIEQSFQEALAIYPPCGRRKIILSDEGKMYGRNELIARYIKLRTGKTRTRKQVSSHIQVLSRRKAKERQANPEAHRGLPTNASFWPPGGTQDIKPMYGAPGYDIKSEGNGPAWQNRGIAGPQLRLVEFSAYLDHAHDNADQYVKHLFVHIGATPSEGFLEEVDVKQIYDKFPEKKGGLKELYDKGPQQAFFLIKVWADMNVNVPDEARAFYGVNNIYESTENASIQVSTKVCSFGKQVVEKVETEYASFENGRFVYRIKRSPMCEYMINFIHKLKQLPEKYAMNQVLENFTILQVITNKDSQETLLCCAYVFEVSSSEHGSQHHIYKLVKD